MKDLNELMIGLMLASSSAHAAEAIALSCDGHPLMKRSAAKCDRMVTYVFIPQMNYLPLALGCFCV